MNYNRIKVWLLNNHTHTYIGVEEFGEGINDTYRIVTKFCVYLIPKTEVLRMKIFNGDEEVNTSDI